MEVLLKHRKLEKWICKRAWWQAEKDLSSGQNLGVRITKNHAVGMRDMNIKLPLTGGAGGHPEVTPPVHSETYNL